MNKILKNNSGWISVVSIIVSLIALSISWVRSEPMKTDWMAILVGILALLTSVLVGWQIFALFNFKKEKDETLSNMSSIANSIDLNRILLAESLFNYFMAKQEDYEVIKYGYDLISLSHNRNDILKNGVLKGLMEYSQNGIDFKNNYQLDEALGLIVSLKPMFLGNKEGIENLQTMMKRIRKAKIHSQF
ncbi:hypothetical protein SAMN05443634_105202 [Chishuiella changwenlii]|uniref:Uncharacterized protein n=1 Tax=Chishuiella changwenlii TaxID=1434701 RepID=A0A1M6XCU4_9FLAO|nr:hypothetical protein [Chishuiella changwenlii]GGF00468.1 hypothetical protein GCM10010984_17550 [Chishuiella changwenlii]SHL03777.1 hypothetical protein SAMN05443634_105202 [Chishuiella changwenlii]